MEIVRWTGECSQRDWRHNLVNLGSIYPVYVGSSGSKLILGGLHHTGIANVSGC